MAKANFEQMRGILTNLKLSSGIRLRILKCYIWSVLLYGCETWTISKKMKKRLEETEAYQKNNENSVGGKDKSGGVADGWCDKGVIDHSENKTAGVSGACLGLEKDCLLGMIEECRARGRQRLKYMDDIKEMVGREQMEEVRELAGNRRLALHCHQRQRGTALREGKVDNHYGSGTKSRTTDLRTADLLACCTRWHLLLLMICNTSHPFIHRTYLTHFFF